MRFECTIMRLVDDSGEDTSEESDAWEMRPHGRGDGRHGVGGGGGGGRGESGDISQVKPELVKDAPNHHTEEYWTRERGKADWVKEEEVLNRGHRASESFAVLNELVVVPSLTPSPLLPSLSRRLYWVVLDCC
jgi:hypothetical protein